MQIIESVFPEVIDNTMRKAFFGCPTKFMRRHTQGLKLEGDESIDLLFGAAFARGMEVTRKLFFFKSKSTEEAIEGGIVAALLKYGNPAVPSKGYKTAARLVGVLHYYFEQWPLADADLVPVPDGVERKIDFELPIMHPESGKPLRYVGKMDTLATNSDGSDSSLVVVDEKTTSRLGDSWFMQWNMDAQLLGYMFAVKREFPHIQQISGQVRGISILKDGYGHAEVPVYRPLAMLDDWYIQLLRDVERMIYCYQSGDWDKAFGGECTAYMRVCDYQKLCLSETPERQLHEYKVEFWNPVAAAEPVQKGNTL